MKHVVYTAYESNLLKERLMIYKKGAYTGERNIRDAKIKLHQSPLAG